MTTEITTKKEVISVTDRLASQYGTEKARFYDIVKSTCKMEKATNAQFETFLLIAEKYNLNPITKQLWAYPDRSGGITTMVSLDGWINIVNNHPQFDGYETSVELDDKRYPISATCTMWRKDRSRPTTKTVYTKEWVKGTSPVWQSMPTHFIEMRAFIQCARMCFNIDGISDPDVAPVLYPDAINTTANNTTIVQAAPPAKFNIQAIEEEIANATPTVTIDANEVIETDDIEISAEIIAKAEAFKKPDIKFGDAE